MALSAVGGALEMRFVSVLLFFLCLLRASYAQEKTRFEELSEKGLELFGKHRYSAAIKVGKEALKIAVQDYGTKHSSAALAMNNLAEFYRAVGQYDVALPLYEESITVWEKKKGADLRLATFMVNQATLHLAKREYSLAQPLLDRAYQIRASRANPKIPNYELAQTMTYLGLCHYHGEELEKSYDYYKAAHEIYEKLLKLKRKQAKEQDFEDIQQLSGFLSKERLSLISSLSTLFELCLKMEKKEEAKGYLRQHQRMRLLMGG